jgi:hypothetical protein
VGGALHMSSRSGQGPAETIARPVSIARVVSVPSEHPHPSTRWRGQSQIAPGEVESGRAERDSTRSLGLAMACSC